MQLPASRFTAESDQLEGRLVFQKAWVVGDLHAAIARFSKAHRIGPWFLQEHFTPSLAQSYGVRAEIVMSVAFTFQGDTMIELVQQHSPHLSTFNARTPSEERVHHVGLASTEFDRDLRIFLDKGYDPVFTAEPSGRLAMLRPPTDAPVLEILEWTLERERLFEGIRVATLEWDGGLPVRPLFEASKLHAAISISTP